MGWVKRQFDQEIQSKLFLTIKDFNCHKNIHSSGNEGEVLLVDFDFKDNETIMQHIIIKISNNIFEIKSRKWIVMDNHSSKWEEWSENKKFECLRKAFETICERGENLETKI